MDGGRVVSESLVTCSPCSRIGCHVAVERVTRTLPPSVRRSLHQGPHAPASYVHPVPLHLPVSCTPGLPAVVGARGVRETHGSRNAGRVPSPPPVLSRFRTTSIMSVYSLDQARCLWQRMNSNLNMYCRRQINIYSRDRVAPAEPPVACSIVALRSLRHFSSSSFATSSPPRLFSAPLLNVI